MNFRNIILGIFLLLAIDLSAQDSKYLEAKAVIKSIETKHSGKKDKDIATVSFVTQNGDSIETIVELVRLPVLGRLKNVNDEITINYNVENPALVETDTGSFISKYGMYILILLGIIFSLSTYLKARKKSYK